MAGLPSSPFMEARRRKPVGPSLRDGLPAARSAPRGFTLTELLVAISIVLVLMVMIAAAAAAATNVRKVNATRSLIAKLDVILANQLATYDGRSVDLTSIPAEIVVAFKYKTAQRAWSIRRNMISGDMPDRWTDVAFMSSNPKWVPASASQRSYIALWKASAAQPSAQFAGAECLFMIVMQGGIADCIDCGPLALSEIGDKDNDGFMEFLDGWGNPIGFILWPAALELPGGSGQRFFAGSRSLQAPGTGEDLNQNGVLDAGEDANGNGSLDGLMPSLGMRPLIYSAGPDGEYGFNRNSEEGNLGGGAGGAGAPCGDWTQYPTNSSAAPDRFAADNITNFDDEVKR